MTVTQHVSAHKHSRLTNPERRHPSLQILLSVRVIGLCQGGVKGEERGRDDRLSRIRPLRVRILGRETS